MPPMVLEFTYTLDDYVEGNHAHASGPTLDVKGFRFQRGLVGWALFVLLAGFTAFLFLMERNERGVPPPAPLPAPVAPAPAGQEWFARVVLPLAPWMVLFFVIWLIVYLQLRRQQRQQPPRRASFLYDPGKEPPRGQEPGKYAAFLAAVGNYRAAWERQEQLHRPQSVEVKEEGVVISDAVSRAEHRWDGFTHVRETPNLFMLYGSDHAFYMLPKRAFSSEEDVRQFRELLRRTVAERPAPAFPVIAVG